MAMTYAVVPETMMERDTRMTLLQDNVLPEYGGKLRAGTAVIVPAQTAARWRQKGIAVDSAETDKTLKEQKIALLAKIQAEIDAIPEPGVYDQSITRNGEPATIAQQRQARRG